MLIESSNHPPKQQPLVSSRCSNCLKVKSLCLCEELIAFDTRVKVLLLQHPQESRSPLGTGTLVQMSLKNSRLRIGLSWRSLKAAWGDEVDHQTWGVLYLGTKKSSKNKQGGVFSKSLDGIVVLDGNWKQSKTLWWRNSWLMKLHRIVLNPDFQSLYGDLRLQPRKHCVSTIESISVCLEDLKESPEVSKHLMQSFSSFLDRVRGKGQS